MDVKALHSLMGPHAKQLLFYHAFLGCDTTSRVFIGTGKQAFVKKLNDEELQSVSDIFLNSFTIKEGIVNAGE